MNAIRIRMARPALLLLTPLALVAAGCGDPYGLSYCPPDAVSTAATREVLAGYDEAPARPASPARPLSSLPVPAPPKVILPGAPDRPWAGPPRTMSDQPGPSVRPPDANTPRPPTPQRLAAGDAVEVQVDLHPEFSGRWRVKPDGFLDIPDGGAFGPELLPAGDFARSVGRVAELAPEEAARSIGRALQPYVVKPPAVKVAPAARREG